MALDYAHAKGVIHRDLKPENTMVLADGSIKVMDFGIARVAGQPGITSTNLFLGTPMYGAPESVDARSVDQRADLCLLGIIFFELRSDSVVGPKVATQSRICDESQHSSNRRHRLKYKQN